MKNTILSIDLGTRYWGVTILENTAIVLSSVKTFPKKSSVKTRTQEAKKAFLSITDKYKPNILIIEKPFHFWTEQSNYLNKIIEEIKTTAKKQKMKVYEYSPRTVRCAVCNDGNANKKDLAKVICGSHYPELKIHLNQNRKYKDIYWGHLFDSVGLAICHKIRKLRK